MHPDTFCSKAHEHAFENISAFQKQKHKPLEALAQMVMDLAIMHMEQAAVHHQQLDQLQDQPKHQTKIWSPPGPGADTLGLLPLTLPAWTQW